MSLFPRIITHIPGPKSQDLARRLRQAESPNITYLAPDFPVFWETAEGCLVTDVDGNSFLDMTSAFGVAAVGHRHPRVVAAIHAQTDRLIHGMGDVHPSEVKVALCERIAALVPIQEARVILGQNGGDAVEAAMKTAMLTTGKPGVLAFEGGYHGLTYGALDATARSDFRAPFLSQMGRFTSHLPYGADLSLIEQRLSAGNFGAVLAEPIQGRGGIVVPPQGWLAGLHELCAKHGCLLILDEIFTGWGRTGDWFACSHEDVVPDILCVGKAMGGGMPISACVAPASIMDSWGESRGEALHTSTFLGHPVACAAALAALSVLESEHLPARAAHIGALLAEGLQELQQMFPTLINGVRGRGLMLGLELASAQITALVIPKALSQGLILLPAGQGDIVEFIPPLIIDTQQISWGLSILKNIFDFFKKHAKKA